MAIHYDPEDDKPDVFEERSILSIHEAMRRKIWMITFSRCAPFHKEDQVHNASTLASNAVLDFDEFFRTHPS